MPQFIVQLPNQPDAAHDLTEEVVTVGFRKDNAICIRDAAVSGHHGRLVRSDSGYRFEDLDSTNGTYYKDRRITEVDLEDGEVVTVATVSCLYKADKPSSPGLPKPPIPLPKKPAHR